MSANKERPMKGISEEGLAKARAESAQRMEDGYAKAMAIASRNVSPSALTKIMAGEVPNLEPTARVHITPMMRREAEIKALQDGESVK